MRLTKFEHAALLLEQSGKKLFIDPGMFTTAITDAANTAAVVITHEHPDHWTPEQLRRILEASPTAVVYGPEGVVNAVREADASTAVTRVDPGDAVSAGPFSLRFSGGRHAVIHSSIPVVDNVGVLVNDVLYYPGDSWAVPEGVDVDVLAVPAGAPWLKIAEAIDYVLEVKPRRSFPTHEMVLSTAGKGMAGDRIRWATEQGGGEFFPLQPGDTLDL
ncbi:MBL fold metallo-hydrolase [Herbiconiux sp. VKM Ac-1786]|uniref:MBL fold metallo-hydrolase n=1 Tax=Herbiconiux sp. VKM Ac-1786 TaxID=2783824 RepID=UPI00188C12B1|nr:MBL fold metallo-hydrolase [Herbiconiux sp. VKM Ac-1786]MBF4574175.1 MBL fold metallo-hydrolase [Herbiconiux sp. VKM Ac-1786]